MCKNLVVKEPAVRDRDGRQTYLLPVSVLGHLIDGNRWSENQSINRYQSIKLIITGNWYRLVLVNQWSINNHTKPFIDYHWLQWQPWTDVSPATYPPFLGRPGDEIGIQFWPSHLNAKNIPCCTSTRITHLPVTAFPCHHAYPRSSGRGFTEYKVRCQRLSPLPFWGERRRSVYC